MCFRKIVDENTSCTFKNKAMRLRNKETQEVREEKVSRREKNKHGGSSISYQNV